MEAKEALEILRKHDLVGPYMTLKMLKQFRNVAYPLSTWPRVIRGLMMVEYLVGDKDLTEPIVIPEVNMSIGGTAVVKVKIEREEPRMEMDIYG